MESGMSTTSTGSEVRRRLGLRLRLGLVFGTLSGLLCVAAAFAIGERARDAARVEGGRYLARLATEYQQNLQRAGRGRLGAGVDLSRARKERAALEASADPALPVELMLVDRDGTVLVGPPDLQGIKLQGIKLGIPPNGQVVLQRMREGQRYLLAAGLTPAPQGSAAPAWRTFARTRADLAFAAASALQRDILWAGLLLALAGICTGWVLGTRHAQPLEALTQAAQEIAAGNDRAELPPVEGNQEVARLAQALRAMLSRLRSQAQSLREGHEHLQRRVHERTAELVKLQAELQLEVAEARLARDDLARAHEQLGPRVAARDPTLTRESAPQ
jgi:methyl-accepting chemotaxis protein